MTSETVFSRNEKGQHLNSRGESLGEYRVRTQPDLLGHLENQEIHRELQLQKARQELTEIIMQCSPDLPPNETVLPEVREGGGLVGEKSMKRKQYEHSREFKEKRLNQATEMLVVVNDLQLPDCDSEAVGAHLKWVRDNKKKITHYVINGDLGDSKMQSNFAKDLEELSDRTQAEIDAVDWFLETITRLLPDTKKVWVQGNHDRPRWENMIENDEMGRKPWMKTIEEMFDLEKRGWETVEYGKGQYYEWHDRVFWHGHRSGVKSNIAKLELEDTGNVSVTTAHVNRNTYWENRTALGELKTAISHGGFSKDQLDFIKKANSGWSLGFGIYYWHPKNGEQPYMVIMRHGTGRFISPDGQLYSAKGFRVLDKLGG